MFGSFKLERIKFSQIQLNVRMKITTIFRRETKRPYIERIVYRNMTLVFCLVKYNIKKITKITKYLESLPRNPRTVNRGPIRINYNWFAHNFSKSFCFCQNRTLSNYVINVIHNGPLTPFNVQPWGLMGLIWLRHKDNMKKFCVVTYYVTAHSAISDLKRWSTFKTKPLKPFC